MKFGVPEAEIEQLSYEWHQKNELVLMCFNCSEADKNRFNVSTTENELTVTFGESTKFHFDLFDSVDSERTVISCKNHTCSIKLYKINPDRVWPFLESQEVEESDMEELQDDLECDKVLLVNPRMDFIERKDDVHIQVFLYAPEIDDVNFKIHFFKQAFSVFFSTKNKNFLRQHNGADHNTIFEWTVHTRGEIEENLCSYRITSHNLEVKLHKTSYELWNSPSIIDKPVLSLKQPKNDDGKLASNVPAAPPAPPLDNKKQPRRVVPARSIGGTSRLPTSYSAGNVSEAIRVRPYGMTGLDNIGNTCFMNSVLQCLGNCRELRDYFLGGNFQADLNYDNPLGMNGRLATAFSVLIKFLWSGKERSYAPSNLKTIMSIKANQFSGFAQHDSQEFMVELLDGLHEDLNRIKEKPYTAEPPDLDRLPETEAAKEAWRIHKLRNDSIIDDLFKGQFKSTLTCHQCHKVSVKFDEFGCLSVPIPKEQKDVKVIFFWRDTNRTPNKFFVRLPSDGGADALRNQLSLLTDVQSTAITIFETIASRIHRTFSRNASLGSVNQTDVLMAFEILTEEEAGGPVVELAVSQRMILPSPPTKCSTCCKLPQSGAKLKRCTRCYRVGYCNTSCQKMHWPQHKAYCRLVPEPVGCPFIMSLPAKEATYSALEQMAENYARYSVDIFQPPLHQARKTRRNRRGSTSSGDSFSDVEDMEIDVEGNGNDSRTAEESGAYSGEARAEADWSVVPEMSGNSSSNLRNTRSSSVSSNSSNGEEIPRLSSSPNLTLASPQPAAMGSAKKLFSLQPNPVRNQNVAGGAATTEAFKDTPANEPLDLEDIKQLNMDWCTNEKAPMHCFIQNKEIDCIVTQQPCVERSKQTTLDDCMELFTQPENLSEGDSWRCTRCKKPVEATKQMSLWRLPSVLIVQLKRFSFRYVLYSDKIDKFIEYPIRGLDMKAYLSEGSPEKNTTYDLFGVSNHMGRLLGGHYTAFVRTVDAADTTKSEIDWRLCDDSRVNPVSESSIVHSQAYLLLYRRRNDPFEIKTPTAPLQQVAPPPRLELRSQTAALRAQKNLSIAKVSENQIKNNNSNDESEECETISKSTPCALQNEID